MIPASERSSCPSPDWAPSYVLLPGSRPAASGTSGSSPRTSPPGGYLAHAHHLFAEVVLRGLFTPCDTVHIEHPGRLDDPCLRAPIAPAEQNRTQVWIIYDSWDPGRLRLYAC